MDKGDKGERDRSKNRTEPISTRERGHGRVFRRPGSTFLWMQYNKDGRTYRESTRTTDQRKAIKLLERRRAQIIEDTFVTPKTRRAKVDELMEDCLRDYRINQRKSLDDAEARWRLHLSPFFAYRRAIEITSDLLAKYVDQRQSEGVKNATVNRELALLKRAYSLAARATPPKVIRVPHFPHLTERNIRTGFVEDEQYDRLAHACNRAGLWMRGLFECGYTYGWRISELENLRLRQVSLLARTIRLDAGTTKNDEPRIVKMTDTIYGLLGQCMAGKQPHDYVFTRPDAKPVRDFRHTWTTVCCAANLGRIVCPGCGDEPSADLHCSRCSMKRKRKDLKYVGLIFHDLRRTAIRNMIRAGIPEKVAMQISGHKTHSVFNRYNIVSERDLEEAARKLDQRQKETEKLRIQSESSGTEHDSDPYRVKIQ